MSLTISVMVSTLALLHGVAMDAKKALPLIYGKSTLDDGPVKLNCIVVERV
ncbi:MAG: hypothetical protein QMB41_07400 [Rhodospirillales bacterium]